MNHLKQLQVTLEKMGIISSIQILRSAAA